MITLATNLQTVLIILAAIMGVVILFLIAMGFWWALTYNKLVKLRSKVQSSWVQIEVQLKRRFEVIPDLIKIFDEYSKDDLSLLDHLSEIHKSFIAVNKKISVKKLSSINNEFDMLIKEFVSDNKEVVGDVKFNEINKIIIDTHDKIEFSQRFYNDSASLYNNKRQVFPYSFVARVRNFMEAELFEVS